MVYPSMLDLLPTACILAVSERHISESSSSCCWPDVVFFPHRAPSHSDCSLWNQHVARWSLNLVISVTHSICPCPLSLYLPLLSLITLGQWIKQSLAQTRPRGSCWAFVFSTTHDDRPVSLLHQVRSPVS